VVAQTAVHAETGVTVRTTRTVPFSAFDGMQRYPDPFGPRENITAALTEALGTFRVTLDVSGMVPGAEDREQLGLALGAVLLCATWIATTAAGRGMLVETVRVSAQDAEFRTAVTA
jgi:hypothetical protein